MLQSQPFKREQVMDNRNGVQTRINANQIKLNYIFLAIIFLSIVSTSTWIYIVSERSAQQQRQIDQLCNIVITLIKNQELTTSEMGLVYGSEYGFYFADFNKHIAVLEELDPKVPGYAKRNIKWVIIPGVPKKLLEEWSNAPLMYEKYRKIDP